MNRKKFRQRPTVTNRIAFLPGVRDGGLSRVHFLFTLVVIFSATVFVAGCAPVGPAAVKRDRLHYATAVAESWKEQLLLNIVKSRYGDAPLFLDVVSVVSGYSLESEIRASAEWQPTNPEDFLGLGASRKFTDRPTISYSPMTGERYARSMIAPVPLDTLLFVVQQGVAADFIMGLTVESINGHLNSFAHNAGLMQRGFRKADKSFTRILQLITVLQQERALAAEIIKHEKNTEFWFVFQSSPAVTPDILQQQNELKSLLEVPPGRDRVKVVYGFFEQDKGTIGIRTRSLMQILGTLSAGVQIQPEHLEDGSALAVTSSSQLANFTVHSDTEKDPEAYVAVPYERMWFWIDRRDYGSKSTLSAVTILFNFLDGGGSKVSPVLTIPTQ